MKPLSTLYFLTVFSCIAFAPSLLNAASLYIDPATPSLFRGDSLTVAVRLDTDERAGECVNAVDAVINYSANIEPVDISIGKSIFNIWVEQPIIDKEKRTITFAGGIPNGYCGRVAGDPRLTNILTEIILRSPGFSIGGSTETEAILSFSEQTAAYLNDGRGTRAELNTYPSKIELVKTPGSTQLNEWQSEISADNIPPEEFSISLQKDTKAFSGKYYIVFNTTDKQTGIDHYELIEEPLAKFGAFDWGRADAPWVTERSPYILKDQTLSSIVRVKAIDKAGNEYIANLIPEDPRTVNTSGLIYMAGIALFVLLVTALLIVLVRKFVSKLKNKRKDTVEDSDENLDKDVYDSEE